jgi:hypothetical protein
MDIAVLGELLQQKYRFAAILSAMDQMQAFAGHVQGVIIALVLDLWKCETKLKENTFDSQSSDN